MRSASLPVGLVVHADSLGDPVDVVEVRDHLDRVVDGGVGQADFAQALEIGRRGRRRLAGYLDRKVTERADTWRQVGVAVVPLGRIRPFGFALGTEVVGVCANSVVTVVVDGHDDREELPLGAAELGRPEHDLAVEVHRAPEHARAQAHRLDDVEDLAGAAEGGVVLALELAPCFVLVDQA
jgi:hypothetical protein